MNNPEVAKHVAALKDKNWTVRFLAVCALEGIGDASAVPALICALKDRDAGVREHAEKALLKMGGSITLPRKILAVTQFSAQERIDILEQLRHLGCVRYDFPETRALCRIVLDEDNAETREGAKTVLDWLDEGIILVRPAPPDTTHKSQELVRALQAETLEAMPEIMDEANR